MIRRDITAEDGRPCWLLVPQIAHAELAGKLADAWRLEGIPPEIVGDLRTAVHRHDDGWADWDARPGVDPQSGRPLNFDEMRLADSLAIWNRSIDYASDRGAMLGYFVAGHFTRLLRRFDSWRGDSAREDLAREFLTRQEGNMAGWLAKCPAPVDAAEFGVAYLQFFDAVSLWFCCAQRNKPKGLAVGNGEPWTFSPLGIERNVPSVRIEPWPLSVDQLQLTAGGRVVPQARYHSTDELLAATIAERQTLRWRLVP